MSVGMRTGYVDINRDFVSGMADRSISYCCQKRHTESETIKTLLAENDELTWDYISFAVAREVAEFIGKTDANVDTIHLFQMSPDDEHLRLPISLLIVVNRETAALRSLLEVLDSALTEECRTKLDGCFPKKLEKILDVHLVTTDEANDQSGFAAVLSSWHNPPLCVWSKTITSPQQQTKTG